MGYVRTMITNNIERGYAYDSNATQLIDKYLLNNQATRKEAMGYIRTMITNNVKRGSAYKSNADSLRKNIISTRLDMNKEKSHQLRDFSLFDHYLGAYLIFVRLN